MALTSKQAKFVASYQLNHNSTESAINAGYSAKSAPVEGCRLLKNPKIISELEQWKANKRKELTKADFVDIAMEKFDSLEVTEPNSPRFLDIAGKALGYTGANVDSRSITQNNLTINALPDANDQASLWDMARKLLGS